MASNLRVDTILPSSGTTLGIGTAGGSVTFLGDTNITTSGTLTAGSASITGNLGIGGTLTYEDVTNVDSVGVITARDGIRCTGIVTATAFHGDGSALTGVGASFGNSSVNSAGIATFSAFVPTAQGSLSHRNIIVNGDMRIAQRGTSSTSSGYATVDRFKYTHSGTDNAPTQAHVDVASGTTPYTLGFRKAYKITNANQSSGAGVSDRIRLEVNLEAQDIASSGWNYKSSSSFITLSFWCKSSVAQNFYANIRTPDGTSQQYSFETGSLTADTWTKVTKTIPGNSNLTFDNNAELGWNMDITMFMGTDNTTSGNTMNQWYAYSSSNQMPDNTSTWYTTNGATWEITGMQLEVGPVATPFEFRSFADEQRRCQRYCVVYQGNAAPLGNNGQITMSGANGFLAYGNAVNGASPMVTQQLPQVMRTTPSQSVSDGTHFQFWRGWTTTIASTSIHTESVGHSPIHFRYYIGSNGGMNNGDAGILNFSNTSGYQIYDAEL